MRGEPLRVESLSPLQSVAAAREHLEALRRALAERDGERANRDLERSLHFIDNAIRELSRPAPRAPAAPEAAGAQGLPQPLTERETEVLRLLAAGLHNRQIALVLSVAESTVNTHVDHIMNKLGAVDRVQAAVWAARQGLAPLEDWARPDGPDGPQNPPNGG